MGGGLALGAALQRKDYSVIRAAMRYYVEKGVPGSEATLIAAIEAVDSYVNLEPATLLLNCGNPRLEAAARAWADRRSYQIKPADTPGLANPRWGGR